MDLISNSSMKKESFAKMLDDSYRLVAEVSISTQEDDLNDYPQRYQDFVHEIEMLQRDKTSLSNTFINELLQENETLRQQLMTLEMEKESYSLQVIEALKQIKMRVQEEQEPQESETRQCKCILF